MATVVYGIRNCDTVRKARRWLDAHGIDYRFHDLRGAGLDAATLDRWVAAVGIDALLNRRGRTWRDLPAATREGLDDDATTALLLAHVTLIRRPVLEHHDAVAVGFAADDYAARFGAG